MFTLIGLAALVAALYFVYKWFVGAKAEVEQDAQAVEAAVQTDAKVAEAATANVVNEIKAKL